MMISLLYFISFVMTKFLGIDRTLTFFKRMGTFLMKLPQKHKSLEQIENELQRGLRLVPVAAKCLDQAVVAWTVLNFYRYPAVFRIGVSLSPVESHAWVTVGDRVFVDTYNLADLSVVAQYSDWKAAKN